MGENEYFVAIDLGASSGRLILLSFPNLELKEIHRFSNGFKRIKGHDRWPIRTLVKEILIGFEKIYKLGIKKCCSGIDTWGVDYCLVGKNGELVEEPISYRDNRTKNTIKEFSKVKPLDDLYKINGIQEANFNTIFQLYTEDKSKLKKTQSILFLPNYLGFVFTGKKVVEKTIASTSGLLNIKKNIFDDELLKIIGVKKSQFPELVNPKTLLGPLKKENFSKYQLPEVEFINVASHDTASAVLGTPFENSKNKVFLSSGTWSILGTEIPKPMVNDATYKYGYSNEAGGFDTIRLLKNINGMFLIQKLSSEFNNKYSYPEIAKLTQKVPEFIWKIDLTSNKFLNPKSIVKTINDECQKTNQKIPNGIAEYAKLIYDNLVLIYKKEISTLEKITSKKIKELNIIGGGSNNKVLNSLIAKTLNIDIKAGPAEATAIGNIFCQMLYKKIYKDIKSARAKINMIE